MAEVILVDLLSSTVSSLLAVLLTDSPLASAFAVCASEQLLPEERAAIRVRQKNNQSVVSINYLGTKQHEITLDDVEVSGCGSGFIWDSEGHIITNYHVIEYASIRLWVTLADNSIYEANVAGVDKDNDIAILHIDVAGKKLRPVRIGVSAHLLVGQNVYAFGNPYELRNSFSKGVISELGREIPSTTGYMIQNVIQHDAAMNPGNSGGPLLDSTGHVIGVNTQICSCRGEFCGIGFSIPIETVVEIADRILDSGRVTRRKSMWKHGVNGVLNRMVRLRKRAFLKG